MRWRERLRCLMLSDYFPRGIRRVLLVQPPDCDASMFDVETARRGRYSNYPPYGLMVLAANLRQIGVEVRIVNLNDVVLCRLPRRADFASRGLNGLWDKDFAKIFHRFVPDLIGITCMFTMSHASLKAVCKRIPGVPIAIGGVHVSNDIDRVLDDIPEAAFAFKGEADNAIKIFVRTVNEHRPIEELRQVVINNPRRHFDEEARPSAEEISIIPAYDLCDISGYSARGTIGAFGCFLPQGTRVASVLSNRGCRACCTFCSVRNFNGVGVRQRSVASVVDELRDLHGRDIRHITFLDDDLYKDERRFIRLADAIVNQNLGLTWDATNGVIAASCTEEVVAASEASGCIAVNIGVESGNKDILRQVRKPGTVKNFLAAAEIFRRHPSIHTSVFLMIGFPGETWGQMQDTIRVAEEMDCDWYRISQFQPLPGSPMADLNQPVGAGIRFMGGAFGRQAEIERGKAELFAGKAKPFAFDQNHIPTPNELNDIWFYMNWRLNFARIEREQRPVKIAQLKAHLSYLADVISPENALALWALDRLGGSPELRQRLRARLDGSAYWRERFSALGLDNAI